MTHYQIIQHTGQMNELNLSDKQPGPGAICLMHIAFANTGVDYQMIPSGFAPAKCP